jgi:hypothetical protein
MKRTRYNDLRNHDEDHEVFLLSLTCGDLPADSDEALERLRACRECRDDWEGMQPVVGDLAGWARERDEVGRDLAGDRAVAGSERVEPFLRARMAERRERSRRWVPLAAAAALAVGVGGWFASEMFQGEPTVGQTLLGEGELSVAVQYDPARKPTVVWAAAAPAGGRYELRWHTPDGGRALGLPPERPKEPRWSPSEAQAAALPDEYTVVVTVLDAQDTPLLEGSVAVSVER